MKEQKLLTTLGIFFILLFSVPVNAQTQRAGKGHMSVLENRAYGFTIMYQGTLVKRGQNDFVIELPQAASTGESRGRVSVFVSAQPFVYLPGTYGGKYYFESGTGGDVGPDFVPGDSITVNGIGFAQDYWAVYAGQGQWETVDNCYAFHDGRYYIISMNRDFLTGMPGERVNGATAGKPELRARLFSTMRDTSNVYVKSFNQIVNSFSILK